ncbi:MAG TPA: hypothetical protein VFZ89_03030, partial [Solirubrobacteraceae bacterium]
MRRVLAISLLAALLLTAAAEPAGNRWTALKSATVARTEVAAVRVGSAAYVFGGYVPPNGATTAITERYDARRNR